MRNGTLTARGLDRIRRVALTVADLMCPDDPLVRQLDDTHVAAALELRPEVTFLAAA
jgi:predicted ATPase with chaperone activity